MTKALPKSIPSIITGFGQGNYPAGSDPWSGQPTGVTPVNPYFTPGQAPPAEYSALMTGLNASTIQTLMDAVCASWASNWPSWTPTEDSQMNSDYARIGGWSYSGITKLSTWLCMGGAANLPTSGSNTMTVLQSQDGGLTFQSLNFPSTGFTAHSGDGILDGIAGDGSAGVVATANDFTTVPAIHLMALYSGTWHSATANYAGSFPTSLYFDVASNVYVYGDVTVLYTLPVASTTPTGHFFTGAPSGAASALTSLIVPKGDGSGVVVPATQTGTPWQHSAQYSTVTTTTPTYGAFPMLVTNIVTAGDFGPTDNCYMVAKYDGSSSTHFITSTDGVVWSDVGSVVAHITKLANLAGRVWIASTSAGQMFYSLDAGVTWTPNTNKIAGNINQFLAFKSNYAHTQIAAFGSFSYKNVSTPTESRFMIAGISVG